MKRFGGIEFLSSSSQNTINLIDETVIQRIKDLIIRYNQSTSTINTAKIASLFRISPPQASVFNKKKKTIFFLLKLN